MARLSVVELLSTVFDDLRPWELPVADPPLTTTYRPELDEHDLPQMAATWEARVTDLVGDDPDIAEYVTGLEQRYDTAEATGDEIAYEFERYLRRRGR